MTPLTSKVLLIEGCDFEQFPVGGQLTLTKHLIRAFGEKLALVGISTDDTPVGAWTKKHIEGQALDFFSIGKTRPTGDKPLIPRRLSAYLQLRRYRKKILESGLRHAYVLAPEVMLAISGWGMRVAYRFSGVENPLSMPRYSIGKLFAVSFERRLFAALADRSELIMAAADEEAIAAMLARSGGLLERREIVAIPTVVDTRIFNLRRVHGDAGPLLVSCGRLNRVKGWDLVFDAFLEVKSRLPTAQLCFVGDGEDRGKLEARVREHGVADSVSITGFITPREVAAILNTAHVFLLGSHREGWPTALVEAQACGLPAVSARVSGVSSLIRDGENGFIVETRDASAFAEKIGSALKLDCPNELSVRISRRYSADRLRTMIEEQWPILR